MIALRYRAPGTPRPFRMPLSIGRLPVLAGLVFLVTCVMLTQLDVVSLALTGVQLLQSSASSTPSMVPMSVDRIAALLAADYHLRVFDEPAQTGKAQGIEGWRGYAASFPDYVIHPHRLAISGQRVAVSGHTTGSHLGLADEEESRQTLIWIADVEGGLIARWAFLVDTPANRAAWPRLTGPGICPVCPNPARGR